VASDLWAELKPKQAKIELALRESFDALTRLVPARLREAMEYSLFAGGKRLRPLLAGLACEAVGGRFEQALPAGIAVEFIHTYSLIHDDLPAMDDDDLRRGRPTCHKVYGDAMAILTGDALQPLAFEILANSYQPSVAAVMVTALARGAGATGMVGGQVLDLIADGRIPASLASGGRQSAESSRSVEHLESIHRKKTGALFEAALVLGATASREEVDGADDPHAHQHQVEWLKQYADAFGLLFQITDDLLDAEGNTAATGKKTGKDATRGKLTYPGLLGIEASKAKAKELADACVQAAERFGERGEMLARLARFVERRDR
jgi:geranylgeranyl diphosphate synthase type II